jgi:hypothetical protein
MNQIGHARKLSLPISRDHPGIRLKEWLALLLRIREAPGSNLGPETGCPDRFMMVFLSSFGYVKLGHTVFFRIIYIA